MTQKNKTKRYILVDHICKYCRGRIAMQTSTGGASGGGNATYICTLCEVEVAWTGPQALCLCGLTLSESLKCFRAIPPKMGNPFIIPIKNDEN
jgi:hypothetical protein